MRCGFQWAVAVYATGLALAQSESEAGCLGKSATLHYEHLFGNGTLHRMGTYV
jgi:hypothetical protein